MKQVKNNNPVAFKQAGGSGIIQPCPPLCRGRAVAHRVMGLLIPLTRWKGGDREEKGGEVWRLACLRFLQVGGRVALPAIDQSSEITRHCRANVASLFYRWRNRHKSCLGHKLNYIEPSLNIGLLAPGLWFEARGELWLKAARCLTVITWRMAEQWDPDPQKASHWDSPVGVGAPCVRRGVRFRAVVFTFL